MLNRRQVDVQFQNLATMCRMTVKSLIDYACVNTHVDEDCEEFVNFCAVFEQMVAHRIRPYQKKVWHRGQGQPRHFWEVMLESHRHSPLFRSCIPNIAAIENIKSPKAKLRAFVRVALMEKRLSDYLQWLQNNRSLMDECYLEGALFTSEEGLELCGDIIGLSAIDFNFCLRGNENDLLGPLEINYVPFLHYTQSRASRLIDEEEMLQLSGKMTHDDRAMSQSSDDDRIKLQMLERDFRGVKEQKDYLEELVRLRERQMGEANMRVEATRSSLLVKEKEWEAERATLDTCILELQDEISAMRSTNTLLKSQISELQLFKTRLEFRDVQMVDLAAVSTSSSAESHDPDKEGEQQTNDNSSALPMFASKDSSNSSKQMSADQRSILSGISDQIRLKEDTQSLIPLTGSLADVNIAMIRDNQHQSEENPSSDWKRAETGGDSVSQGKAKDKDGFVNVELTLFEPGDKKIKAAPTEKIDNTSHSSPTLLSLVTASASHTPSSSSLPSPAPISPKMVLSDSDTQDNSGAESNSDESFVITEVEGDAEMEKLESTKNKAISKPEELCSSASKVSSAPGKDETCTISEKGESSGERESQEKQEIRAGLGGADMSQALEDLEKAFDTKQITDSQEGGPNDQPKEGQSSCNSSERDVNVSNNNGDDISVSEPEIVDKVNTSTSSSEGSDANWELLSEPDESEKQ